MPISIALRDPVTMVPVKNLEVAKRFYEDVLGLVPHGEPLPGIAMYKSGHAALTVYQSEYAGTNKATLLLWIVGEDLERLCSELRDAGVSFEHYDDLPHLTRDGDIHSVADLRIAWFKDPDANIISLQNR